jgi:hypothetical protein
LKYSSLLKEGERKTNMSATATLPLPLELTKPVELSSTLEEALREAFDVANTKYNYETQLRENAEGVTQFYNNTTQWQTSTKNNDVDIQIDVQIDL